MESLSDSMLPSGIVQYGIHSYCNAQFLKRQTETLQLWSNQCTSKLLSPLYYMTLLQYHGGKKLNARVRRDVTDLQHRYRCARSGSRSAFLRRTLALRQKLFCRVLPNGNATGWEHKTLLLVDTITWESSQVVVFVIKYYSGLSEMSGFMIFVLPSLATFVLGKLH